MPHPRLARPLVPGIAILLTYLLGAVPFGLVLARRFADIDVRTQGSGNIGATNVARVAGKRLGLATLVLDLAKGVLPVLASGWWLPEVPWLPSALAVAAVVGHCWPLWLRFRGGKGVATSAGVLLVLAPLPTLGAAAVWGATFAVAKKSSLAALVALVAMLGLAGWLAIEVLPVVGVLGVVLVVRHVDNIRRLVSGSELDV